MSTTETSPRADDEWRRDNFWGKADDGEESESHIDHGAQSYSEHIAHRLLKENAPKYCGTTLNEPAWNGGRLAEQMSWLLEGEHIDGHGDALHHENKAVELSDSEYYPPVDTPEGWAADGTSPYHAARVNEETGYLNFGRSTYIQLGSVEWPALKEAIHTYGAQQMLAEWKIESMTTIAKRMKKNPNCKESDLDILSEVLEKNRRNEL